MIPSINCVLERDRLRQMILLIPAQPTCRESFGSVSVCVWYGGMEGEREKHIKEQIVNISRFIWPIVK